MALSISICLMIMSVICQHMTWYVQIKLLPTSCATTIVFRIIFLLKIKDTHTVATCLKTYVHKVYICLCLLASVCEGVNRGVKVV